MTFSGTYEACSDSYSFAFANEIFQTKQGESAGISRASGAREGIIPKGCDNYAEKPCAGASYWD
jgi:hypothetical protein